MTPSRRRMTGDMTLRNFTPQTIQSYFWCVARGFGGHHNKCQRLPVSVFSVEHTPARKRSVWCPRNLRRGGESVGLVLEERRGLGWRRSRIS
jgi:hypothetical protein